LRPGPIGYGCFRVPAPFGDRAAGALHLWRVNVAWQVMRGWYDDVLDVL
jgi:hypothetical protein